MKFDYNAISALQINEVCGPVAMSRSELLTARASITNYKKKWPGSDFETRSEDFEFVQPNGESFKLCGYYKMWVKRISYGFNPSTGEKEAALNM